MLVLGILIGLVLYAAFVFGRCFFRVDEGYVAVLTTFGAAEVGEGGKLVGHGPGLHRKKPWQRVVHVSMKEQNLELSGDEGGRMAMADDGTILRFDSILRYVPVEHGLDKFLFEMHAPLDHITSYFTCLLRNEIANFRTPPARDSMNSTRTPTASNDAPASVAGRALMPGSSEAFRFDFATQAGSYALIRRERKLLNRNIEDACRAQIGERYGVKFNAVDLTDVLPPDELADALNAVIQAQSEAETHFLRAEGECQQRILSAERGVDIARARAAAIETEIATLGEYLAELDRTSTLADYVARRRAETLAESRTLYLKETLR